ncbi:MAG: TrmH family RNA methyltransferase [Treponemataceae bacterium]
MIEFFKLAELPRSQKLKKLTKIFEFLEKSLVANLDEAMLEDFYLKRLFQVFEEELDEKHSIFVKKYFANREKVLKDHDRQSLKNEKLILINKTRHYLYALTGLEPSEWDLILPNSFLTEGEKIKRNFFKNIFVYAETIRSPFNLGSIFRTSDAFGVEKVFLSPDCTSSESPRAKRSAMGTLEYIPYERKPLAKILQSFPKDFPVLALETGGTDINNFDFPKEGIVLLGSEELGLSPKSLKLATNRLSIKMHGIKASINVGVAFGIFMERWITTIQA